MLNIFLSVILMLFIVFGSAYYIYGKDKSKEKLMKKLKLQEQMDAEKLQDEKKKKKKKSSSIKTNKLGGGKKKKKREPLPSHENFSHAIKGHSQNIINFAVSPNKKWIATSSQDQSVRVTELEDTMNNTSSGRVPLFFRINMEGDTITSLSWAADSLTLIGSSESSREVYFFRMRQKKNSGEKSSSSGFKYELIELKKRRFNTYHSGIIQSCSIDTAYSSPIIVTGCDCKSDKYFYVWDSKNGTKIGQVPNKSCSYGGAILSTDGHFICNASTKNSEVKIFEVVRKKEKGSAEPVFQNVSNKHVMVLAASAHKSNVNAVCFGPNDAGVASGISDRVVTAGEDGYLVLWDIDVRFDLKADPEILSKKNVGSPISKCTMSLNGKKIACVDDSSNIYIYDCEVRDSKSRERVLKEVLVINNDGSTGGKIKQIAFSDYEGNKMAILNENKKQLFVWNCNC